MIKNILFLNRGAFTNRIEIFDHATIMIGGIVYSTWPSKAKIYWNGEIYYWEASNFWATRWKLVDEKGREIHLVENEFSVNGSDYENKEFLFLLSTFLIYNYYKKMALIAAI